MDHQFLSPLYRVGRSIFSYSCGVGQSVGLPITTNQSNRPTSNRSLALCKASCWTKHYLADLICDADLACVASVPVPREPNSGRANELFRIRAARKMRREQKSGRWGRERLPANPSILKNAQWFSRLSSFLD